MAGAKPGVHVVQLKPISVPKSLQEGAKFVKWDEDSAGGTPVTLKVDSKGFFLYWTDQNKESEILEITCIRDTRTGKYARVPKDAKLRETVNMGAQDTPLEDKTLTVVHGTDLVNISFINFCCNCREIAKEWTDELMKMAYNLLALNASAMTYLAKAYTKMTIQTYKDGKIPVKDILRMFAKNQEDKKRVEKALEAAGYSASKTDTIDPSKFTFEDFFSFYKYLTGRQEVEKIFDELCGGGKKKNNYLTAEQFVKFLNDTQRDPRLNEILYQFATVASIKDIIHQYEPNKSLAQKGLLSFEGFLRYLMSDDNAIMAPEKYDLSTDMNQPLSHYFINSSHNTYLTGHQLTGKSSVEMYRQCLLAGCRCVELDCWNGRTSEEEPIITHGYTVVTDINFKEVVDAIAECAFKTSEFPVILSFENHCSAKQQAKMATYCTKVFGDLLQSEPLPSHPVAPGVPLPSPNQLLRKIIIKNKKKHYHRGSGARGKVKKVSSTSSPSGTTNTPLSGSGSGKPEVPRLQKTNSKDSNGEPTVNGDETLTAPNGDLKDFESSSSSDEDDDGSGTEDAPDATQEQGTASQESEAGAELSALVNYIQPVHFHGFDGAEKRNRSYEISSFVETVATALLKERPVEFVNYNKRQLSRLYPKGTRVDSSNYMPQVFWNAGCQLVALNFQSLDLALQLNLGIFEYNARSGYLLKPDFMRRHDRRFDPFAESTVDGIIAGSLHVQIISGMFLSDKRVGTYVEVESYGLPTDTFRKKFRTKVVPANGINPVYDEAPFVLKKVVLPELAVLRIAVYEEGGKMIGHRILPIVGLRPGYRHIGLRNESGQPLTLPVIFVHIIVKDYVPDDLSKFAEALANPIEYTARIKERAQMLEKLLDSDDEEQGDKPQVSPCLKPGGPLTPVKTTPQKVCSFERTGSVKEGMNGSPLQVSSPKVGMDSAGRSSRISVTQSSSQSESTAESKPTEIADVVLVAESLDKIKQDSKLVQSVISKLEKDLQALRKKHDKAVSKEQEMKQQKEEKLTQPTQEKKSTLAKTHSRLFKKLSRTNVEEPPKRQSDVNLGDVADHVTKLQELHRTHSQSILSLFKDHYLSDLELRKKYHEPLYSAIEKAMQTAQAAQMKELQNMHESDKTELLKGLDAIRSEEIKTLKKNPRDKNEFNRIKREIYQKHIDLAVSEIQKLNDVNEKKKKDLEVQHEEVKKKFDEEKAKALEKLQRDYEEHCQRLPQECSTLLSIPDVPAPSKDITLL